MITCKCEKCGREYEAEIKSTHRVMCGDSTSVQDVERLMAGKSATLCFTSPPYNVCPMYPIAA